MALEAATVRQVEKPWGRAGLGQCGALIGEHWFERHDARAAKSELLLKVLFTSKALSVQVHPDDQYAHTIGLPNGKTEAWYVLSAEAEAQVAIGLNTRLTRAQLRSAIADGSIAALLAWRTVAADDVILVPAGTIHAIGAGIVLVEIQQHSDATFRILDLDHDRSLDIEHAVACARAEPAEFQLRPERISDERSLLVSTEFFVFERIELPPHSLWRVDAKLETWIYGLSGSARASGHRLAAGQVVVAEAETINLEVGANGVACLVAYPGHQGISAHLLAHHRQSTGHVTAQVRDRDVDAERIET